MAKNVESAATPAKAGPPRWVWVFAAVAIVLLVAWQLASGLFVKSVAGPDGMGLTFAPRDTTGGQNTNNILDQSGGSGNQAAIDGSDNQIHQSGTDNTATIGGLPPNWKPPGGDDSGN